MGQPVAGGLSQMQAENSRDIEGPSFAAALVLFMPLVPPPLTPRREWWG